MYLLMRKNGVLVHMDERVGTEFIDMKSSFQIKNIKGRSATEEMTILDQSINEESRQL